MAALLCVALFFVWLVSSRRQSVRLPSGEVLTLLGVADGTKPFLYPHSLLSRLLSALHLTNGIKFGPLHYPPITSVNQTFGIYSQSQPFSNSIMMVLRHERHERSDDSPLKLMLNWHFQTKATLADESGDEWEGGPNLSGAGGDWFLMRQLDVWEFKNFPRRGAELRFRVYTNGPDQGWITVVDFKMPNHYRGDYPRWPASPLPAVLRTNQLEASLISISCGLSDQITDAQTQGWSTRFRLQLLENGDPSSQWSPRSFHAVDATGNEWTSRLDSHSEAGGVWPLRVAGKVFSPDEVWRMSFTFVRQETSDTTALRGTSPSKDDLRTFDFLVQPPTNPPNFKNPIPARSQ